MTEQRDVNEWLSDPNTTTCEVYGHLFEPDPERPGVQVCTAGDCDDEYIDDENIDDETPTVPCDNNHAQRVARDTHCRKCGGA